MKKRILALLCLAVTGLSASVPLTTIKNVSGTAASNVPVTLSCLFCEGEIAEPRGVLLGRTEAACQWDVKRTWGNGSIKHALVSFSVPSIAEDGEVIASFNGSTVTGNTPLTTASILATDFDARAVFTGGGTSQTVSARDLLSRKSTEAYWLSGPKATEFILRGTPADVDTGITVQFEIRFYEGLKQARVSFVVENAFENSVKNSLYDISLQLGHASPAEVFKKRGTGSLLQFPLAQGILVGRRAGTDGDPL